MLYSNHIIEVFLSCAYLISFELIRHSTKLFLTISKAIYCT